MVEVLKKVSLAFRGLSDEDEEEVAGDDLGGSEGESEGDDASALPDDKEEEEGI